MSPVLAIIFFLPLVFTQSCAPDCNIQPGYDISHCDWYLDPSGGLSFLPTGYAKSAHCACRMSEVYPEAKNSSTLKCVRKFLKGSYIFILTLSDAHTSLPKSLIEEMAANKSKGCDEFSCSIAYHNYIQHVWFPIAYEMHVDSFEGCCCPHGVAPKWAWRLIMFDWKIIPNYCSFVAHSIEQFGKCGCQGW